MGDEPIIVVHGKEQAVAALASAADANIAVLLVSQRGGVSVWGAEGFKALIESAEQQIPTATFRWALDCSDDPGYALAAFRVGVAGVVFDPVSPAYNRIADIAVQYDIPVDASSLYDGPLLDLSQVGDARAACDTFLNEGKDQA